jgi:hypothetical protein
MHGLPTIGTIGFGWFEVSGRAGSPPPAITTAFTAAPRDAPWHVLARRDDGEPEADPEQRERPPRVPLGDEDERERCVEAPRSRPCRARHLELVAARHDELVPADEHEVTEQNHERDPRQPVVRDEEHDADVDHQPVGERVGDLAERRLGPASGARASRRAGR